PVLNNHHEKISDLLSIIYIGNKRFLKKNPKESGGLLFRTSFSNYGKAFTCKSDAEPKKH
ncbi:MAG: hypothetical protein RR553_09430, partial [Akkermansia sp.]